MTFDTTDISFMRHVHTTATCRCHAWPACTDDISVTFLYIVGHIHGCRCHFCETHGHEFHLSDRNRCRLIRADALLHKVDMILASDTTLFMGMFFGWVCYSVSDIEKTFLVLSVIPSYT